MKDEMKSLHDNHIFELVKISMGERFLVKEMVIWNEV